MSAPTLATLVFGTAVLFRGIDKARLVFEQEIDELNILLLGPRATHTHIPRVDRVIPATCALRVVTPWNVLSNLFPDPPPEPVLCNSAAENVVDLVVNLVVDPIAVAAAHRGEEPRVVDAHDEAGRRV